MVCWVQRNDYSPENPYSIPNSIHYTYRQSNNAAFHFEITNIWNALLSGWHHVCRCEMSTTGTHRLFACIHCIIELSLHNRFGGLFKVTIDVIYRWNWENTKQAIIYSLFNVDNELMVDLFPPAAILPHLILHNSRLNANLSALTSTSSFNN